MHTKSKFGKQRRFAYKNMYEKVYSKCFLYIDHVNNFIIVSKHEKKENLKTELSLY